VKLSDLPTLVRLFKLFFYDVSFTGQEIVPGHWQARFKITNNMLGPRYDVWNIVFSYTKKDLRDAYEKSLSSGEMKILEQVFFDFDPKFYWSKK
jgi:hypothetical protein